MIKNLDKILKDQNLRITADQDEIENFKSSYISPETYDLH